MLKIDFGMAQDSGQSKRPLIETPSKIFYFILNRLGFFLPCFLLCASVFCMIFFEREGKNPNRWQKSINQRNIATDVLYKMHTKTYNQSAFDAFLHKNQCACIRTFVCLDREWQSIAQNLLIYFILLVVQVFDFCLFSSIFFVFAFLVFVPAHKYINGANNSFEWYALYVSLHSVHFFPLPHVEFRTYASTVPDTRTTTEFNLLWKSYLSILVSFSLIPYPTYEWYLHEHCDFLMSCFHIWFSLLLLSTSFFDSIKLLVWHMFKSKSTKNKNQTNTQIWDECCVRLESHFGILLLLFIEKRRKKCRTGTFVSSKLLNFMTSSACCFWWSH